MLWKKNTRSMRSLGALMAVIMAVSCLVLPPQRVYSAELIVDSESFDINTNVMEIEFTMSMTQYVNIAVYEYEELDEDGRPTGSLLGYVYKSALAKGEKPFEPQHYKTCRQGVHPQDDSSDVDITEYRPFDGVIPPEERGGGLGAPLQPALAEEALTDDEVPNDEKWDDGKPDSQLDEDSKDTAEDPKKAPQEDDISVSTESENSSNPLENLEAGREIGRFFGKVGSSAVPTQKSAENSENVTPGNTDQNNASIGREDAPDSGGDTSGDGGSSSAGANGNDSGTENSGSSAGQEGGNEGFENPGSENPGAEGSGGSEPGEEGPVGEPQEPDAEEETVEEETAEAEAVDYGPQVLSLTTRILDRAEWEEEQRRKQMSQFGIAAFAMEITPDSSLEFDEEAGVNRFIWDGRVDRHAGLFERAPNGEPDWYPVLGSLETEDTHVIYLQIEIIGYPWKNIEPLCTIDDGVVTHVTEKGNYEWSNNYDYYMWTSVFVIDYRAGTYLKIAQGEMSACIQMFLKLYQWDLISFEELSQKVDEGDPINVITGNLHFEYTDLEVHGDWPLKWQRFYNSLDDSPNGLGQGFSHTYDYTLEDDRGIIRVEGPYGQYLEFMREYIEAQDKDVYRPLQDADFELTSSDRETYYLTYVDGSRFELYKEEEKPGRLEQITNPGGLLIADLSYDASDRLIRVENRAGHFDLNWSGNSIRSVEDHTGRRVTYGYENGAMTSMTNPDGDSVTYEYDSNGYLSALSDFEGYTYLSQTYDGEGRVLTQTMNAAGTPVTMSVAYDDSGQCNTVRTFYGETKRYHYDDDGQVVRIEESDGDYTNTWNSEYRADSRSNKGEEEITYDMDRKGNVQKASYGDGNTITVTYDANNRMVTRTHRRGNRTERFEYSGGNLTKYTDGAGNVTEYTYVNGLPATKKDQDGYVTTYDYNSRGQLLSVDVASLTSESYEYDNLGRMIKKIDPLGAETTYQYTPQGKLISRTNEEGHVASYEYDRNGMMTRFTDYRGNSETYTYTGMSYLKEYIDKDGNVTSYTYTREGDLETKTDFNGGVTRLAYDDRGNVSRITYADQSFIKLSYDSLGRLETYEDEEGNTETYAYDAMGRLAKTVSPNDNVTEVQYDWDGNLVKEIRRADPDDAVTEYLYDNANRLTAKIDPEGGRTEYVFNGRGLITLWKDPAGRTFSFEYDGAGRRTKVTDGNGFATEYKYDPAGNVISIRNPEGHTATFTYDILGRKISETTFGGKVNLFEYDENDNLLKITNPENGETSLVYDPLNRVRSITDPMGYQTEYSYRGTFGIEEITYPDGETEAMTYNVMGLVSQYKDRAGYTTAYEYTPRRETARIVDAQGDDTRFQYDPDGNLVKVIRGGVDVTVNVYDDLGRVVTVEDPKGTSRFTYDLLDQVTCYENKIGGETFYVHDGSGLLVKLTDAEGGVFEYKYDGAGRITQEIEANQLTTEYTYDKIGNVLKVQDQGGSEVWTYDLDGNVTSYVDRNGNLEVYQYSDMNLLIHSETVIADAPKVVKMEYTYDLNGNLLTVLDPHELLVSYTYDWAGNVVKEVDQLNHAETYGYDLNFNLTWIKDRLGNETKYEYDKLNRLVGVTDPEGSVISYAYDVFWGLSEITQLTELGASTTKLENDPLGNVVSVTTPLLFTSRYTTDGEGNVVKIEDADGNVNEFSYDKLSRLVEARYQDEQAVTYQYDPVGNISQMTEGADTTLLKYDYWSRLTEVTDPAGKRMGYQYDANGNTTKVEYPDGTAVTYEYDHMNRMVEMSAGGEVKSYQYDPKSQLIREEFPTGEVVSYSYNEIGQLKETTVTDADEAARRQILYGYHPNGWLWNVSRLGIDTDKRAELTRYSYDGAGKLTETTVEGQKTSYEYDVAGNLIQESSANESVKYAYDLQNRLVKKEIWPVGAEEAASVSEYTYDKRGNLIEQEGPEGSRQYQYNSAGRMVLGTNESGETSSYRYNGLGARVSHEEVRDNYNAGHQNGTYFPSSWESSKTLEVILKEGRHTWQRVWESSVGSVIQNDRETVTKHYVIDYAYGVFRDASVSEDGSYVQTFLYDTLELTPTVLKLSYAEDTNRADAAGGENPGSDIANEMVKQVWFHSDLNGSNLYGTDVLGDLEFHMIYSEWGVPQLETSVDMNFYGLDNLNNFTGYTYDEVLGVYFAQTRFYDPVDKRFTQEDPIRSDANWYSYADNNPITMTDPWGLASKKGNEKGKDSSSITRVTKDTKSKSATTSSSGNVKGGTSSGTSSGASTTTQAPAALVDVYNKVTVKPVPIPEPTPTPPSVNQVKEEAYKEAMREMVERNVTFPEIPRRDSGAVYSGYGTGGGDLYSELLYGEYIIGSLGTLAGVEGRFMRVNWENPDGDWDFGTTILKGGAGYGVDLEGVKGSYYISLINFDATKNGETVGGGSYAMNFEAQILAIGSGFDLVYDEKGFEVSVHYALGVGGAVTLRVEYGDSEEFYRYYMQEERTEARPYK